MIKEFRSFSTDGSQLQAEEYAYVNIASGEYVDEETFLSDFADYADYPDTLDANQSPAA